MRVNVASQPTKKSQFRSFLFASAPLLALIACSADQSVQETPEEAVEVSESALFGLPALPALGVPDHYGFVVRNLATATAEFTTATGIQFQPRTSSTLTVDIIGDRRLPKRVTLKEAYSKTANPYIVFVQSSDAIGPWDRDASEPFHSYSVDHPYDLRLVSRLANAGYKLVAAAPDFTYWRGAGGWLIRFVRSSEAPRQPAAGPETLPLGNVAVMSISPCEPEAFRTQFSAALGLTWQPGNLQFTFPWTDPNNVTSLANLEAFASNEPPFVAFEYEPGLPGADRKLPFKCSATKTQAHVVFVTTDVPALDTRWANAGLQPTARILNLISYYRTSEGMHVEAADASIFQAP